jgi:hypothetical protein
MLPEFDDRGYLPAGVHAASLEEIETRFGCESEIRRVQMQSIRWLVDLAKRAGVVRLIINGSFVTDILEPNDVDCALLADTTFPKNIPAADELGVGLPFLDIQILDQRAFDRLVWSFFATDRHLNPKGTVEVIL